jgi:undecaprenyl-diphosphatase
MNRILEIDKNLLLAINHHHSEWLDFFMWWFSDRFIWIPFYALIVGMIIYHYRMKSALILLMITLAVILSDQLASGIFKPLFKRLRPSHEPGLEEMLHYVNNYKGGTYGFISSHALNSFSVFFYILFTIGKRMKWIPVSLFIWVMLLSYSRVYLGVHYPSDIIVPFFISIPLAWTLYKASGYLCIRLFTEPINNLPG